MNNNVYQNRNAGFYTDGLVDQKLALQNKMTKYSDICLLLAAGVCGRRYLGVKYLVGLSSLCGAALAAAPLDSPLFHPPWLLPWSCNRAPEIKSDKLMLLKSGKTVTGKH